MLLPIPAVLTQDQVNECRKIMQDAPWIDGKVTAGHQSAKAKHNLQLAENSDAARYMGEMITTALATNLLFMAAALPGKIFPPLFNCYQGGQSFGTHVDNAIRRIPGTPERIRTDLSCTLFLSDPDEYEGGELVVEDTYGTHQVKLPAGHMILYPSTSLHHVTAVTQGARLASFFWLQSMIRQDSRRSLLFDLDMSIQQLTQATPEHPALIQLTGVYHNLLREWAEV
ncbi:Fe(II)-dependent oxygenase [Pokkaliibacter plantistimulans]|uniref:Fe(II)-dependent oxygenase n=1 Tax=Pokkaliibacter plantistimulans TaxID=1635171 RepID=A0ABX5M480_9GAMM|nr:Fe2+-dependent dioxygenase [Pokkaliibacter plantistimulans]PXF31710.1 Fe(II)-dependent oxygenase [Pokkaliibacter plantistimulans]